MAKVHCKGYWPTDNTPRVRQQNQSVYGKDTWQGCFAWQGFFPAKGVYNKGTTTETKCL